jgi:hypothetical protein
MFFVDANLTSLESCDLNNIEEGITDFFANHYYEAREGHSTVVR